MQGDGEDRHQDRVRAAVLHRLPGEVLRPRLQEDMCTCPHTEVPAGAGEEQEQEQEQDGSRKILFQVAKEVPQSTPVRQCDQVPKERCHQVPQQVQVNSPIRGPPGWTLLTFLLP